MRQSVTTFRSSIVCTIAAVVLLFSSALSASPLADYVVTVSPLGTVADQSRDMMREGIREGLVKSGQVDKAMAETIANISSYAFSGPRIRAKLVADLAESLNDDQLRTVRNWYETDLGKRVSEAEADAAAPEAWASIEAREKSLRERYQGSSRAALFDRYNQASRATESAVETAVAVQVGLAHAMAAVRGEGASAASIEEQVHAHRGLIEEQVEAQVFAGFLHIYEPFSDQELKQYLTFLESPEGREFTRTASTSLQGAIMAPVESIGTQLVRLLGSGR